MHHIRQHRPERLALATLNLIEPEMPRAFLRARAIPIGEEGSTRSAPAAVTTTRSDDLVGVLFRVVKSQAADREIDDFMTVPRSRPG